MSLREEREQALMGAARAQELNQQIINRRAAKSMIYAINHANRRNKTGTAWHFGLKEHGVQPDANAVFAMVQGEYPSIVITAKGDDLMRYGVEARIEIDWSECE